MAKKTNNKNLCTECRFHWFNYNGEPFCEFNYDRFNKVHEPCDCPHYPIDDFDTDDTDYTQPQECPVCGSDAYWEGSCYECEQCGHVF